MSGHRLGIETGRWHRPAPIPYEERKCIHCNELDDEYHFVLECSLHDRIRKLYIPRYYQTHPSMYTFIELMSTTVSGTLKNLAKYCYTAETQRANICVQQPS